MTDCRSVNDDCASVELPLPVAAPEPALFAALEAAAAALDVTEVAEVAAATLEVVAAALETALLEAALAELDAAAVEPANPVSVTPAAAKRALMSD